MDLIEKLEAYFATVADVRTAYLFGSHARKEAGPRSDVDVALILEPERVASGSSVAWRQLELIAELRSVLATNNVDVVLLDRAGPLLAHQILREATIVKDSAPRKRIAMEERIIHRYVDTRPLRERQWQAFRERIRRESSA